VQKSQAIAATDATKIGLSAFDSASFAVDANGFVTASGTGVLKTLTGDTGGAISPTAGNINTLGTGSITIAGSGSTLTTQLTGLTNHAIQVGAGTATLTQLAVGATGTLLVGATSADPAFATSATGDFTFTSSTAAQVRTFTVTNTDNTNTASAALIKSVSGGASAGDAAYQASTTTTSWTFGVDNSVTSPTADPFVISQGTALGTTNVMSIATTGEINYPLQPCFLAIAAAQNSATGDGTNHTITYTGSEIFDQNNDFDGTSTFTAPVDGKYFMNATTDIGNFGAAHNAGNIGIVASNRTINSSNYNWGAIRNATNGVKVCVNSLIDMDAADTCVIKVAISGGTKVVNIFATNTTFSGNLIA